MDPELNGEIDNEKGMDQLSMEELMETSLQTLREGEVIQGTVVAVNADEVLVDLSTFKVVIALDEVQMDLLFRSCLPH